MGWFVDSYNGSSRISHGGYRRDVNSEVTLFPTHGIGIVSFTNFGAPRLARLINDHVFDLLAGSCPVMALNDKLAEYEHAIVETAARHPPVQRDGQRPSRAHSEYAGVYENPAYGLIEIQSDGPALHLHRHEMRLPLEHWAAEKWIAGPNDLVPIHEPHPFDRTSLISFDTDDEEQTLSIQFERAVDPIRFVRRPTATRSVAATNQHETRR
jgi:hypothetical protein